MSTMLRYCLVLLAGLSAAGPAAAATWADAMFDELSKDFGSVPRGPTLKHAFRIVNHTRSPVNISGIRVSCGCTTASVLKPYLNPGEETVLVAYMDTSRFIGVRSVTLFVQFDRPSFEEVRLWIQANARHDFNLSPDTLAFGQIKKGAEPENSTMITFYGNTAAQITEVNSETNYVQASVKEMRRQDSEVAYVLTAKLRNDAPVGKWYTDVWLKTNNPTMPQVRVPLTVEIESALSVSPDRVTLGSVKVQGESERRVVVRGVKPFKITRIEGTDNHLTARDSTTESKPVHVLTVKLKPAKTGELLTTLHIETDLAEDNAIDFQVSATVMP
jgi:hypothetical protein